MGLIKKLNNDPKQRNSQNILITLDQIEHQLLLNRKVRGKQTTREPRKHTQLKMKNMGTSESNSTYKN